MSKTGRDGETTSGKREEEEEWGEEGDLQMEGGEHPVSGHQQEVCATGFRGDKTGM